MRKSVIAQAPLPTIEELRAQMAQRHAELAGKRAARVLAASESLYQARARARGDLETRLSEATALLATAAAACTDRAAGCRR